MVSGIYLSVAKVYLELEGCISDSGQQRNIPITKQSCLAQHLHQLEMQLAHNPTPAL